VRGRDRAPGRAHDRAHSCDEETAKTPKEAPQATRSAEVRTRPALLTFLGGVGTVTGSKFLVETPEPCAQVRILPGELRKRLPNCRNTGWDFYVHVKTHTVRWVVAFWAHMRQVGTTLEWTVLLPVGAG